MTATSTSIAATIPSPPPFYNTAGLTGGASVTIDATKFKILKSVNIYLVGDPVGTKSTVAEFLSTNNALLDAANLRLETQVSSWAIVVDVTWKKAFAPVRKQDTTGTTPAAAVDPAVGVTGDTIAVLVNVEKSAYT